MILTCPECDIRFVVPSTIFASGGRKVKCSSCGHKWFQDNPENKSDSDFTPEDIVRNIPNQDDTRPPLTLVDKVKDDFANGLVTIISTAVVIVAVFVGYMMMQPSLIVGQGLAFDQIIIERAGDDIVVSGNIVNAMNDDRGVPSIKIIQILDNDIEGDIILLAPEKPILASGEMMGFATALENAGATVQNVRVTFQPNNN